MIVRIVLLIGMFFSHLIGFAKDYDAELVLQETTISIDKNRLTKDLYYEIKVNNRAGERHGNISIDYSALHKLSNIEAYIKDSQGKVVKKLKRNDIVERSLISSFSFYEDDFVKEFTLKHNSYPYTIVYSYQIQQKEFLHIDNWLPVVNLNVPTLKANLTLTVPINYGIEYRNKDVADPNIETVGNKHVYKWSTSYTEIIKPEEYAPMLLNFLPSVIIIPKEFNFEINGSLKDWISFGNWQYELLQGLNELPDNEESKIDALIENVETDREKIKILYHYLQDETRYINISIETGGLKPYPACYVSNNKYGDCKALTNYFKAILDYIEIPSYYTIVYAGDKVKEVDKKFPSSQFNHVILYVPQDDEDIWLDCTSSGAFDYLGTFTQNRDVFVVDHDNSHFVKTPSLKPSEVLDTRNITIGYNSENATVKFQNTYKGNSYETISQIQRDYNESQKSRIVRNYILPNGFQLIDYQLPKPIRDSLKMEMTYEATARDIYKHYGNEILISNVAFSLPDFEKPKRRKFPVQIDYPIYERDTITYEIPDGYKLHKSETNYSVQNKYGEYEFNVYEQNGKIVVVKSLLVNAGNYPVSEYSEFYNFYELVTKTENKTHLSLYTDTLHD